MVAATEPEPQHWIAGVMKSGAETWIMFHFEKQSQTDTDVHLEPIGDH